jgi:NhaA family Na+:H+ antiporter
VDRSSPSRRLIEWSRSDRAAGVVLTVATVAAVLWANVDGGSYGRVWNSALSWSGSTGLHFTPRQWVDDGLMTIFFVVIGLEIRRESTAGALASWRRAAGPCIAAVAGMVVPALVYAAFVHDRPGGHGWAIPMATDVAFSLGALAVLARAASLRLRVFLMTLGVADDVLSILVLVVVYSAAVDAGFIVAGIACLGAMVLLRAARTPLGAAPILFSLAAWWAFARGGVEAAVVGVVVGAGLSSPRGWEQRLLPLVTLVVLPVFALANAGVDLGRLDLSSTDALLVFVAILLARVIGKPAGVWLATTLLPDRFLAATGERPSTRTRLGLGTAASVGYTVSLLVARVAFGDGPLADAATAALLAGTLIGLALTALLLGSGTPSRTR